MRTTCVSTREIRALLAERPIVLVEILSQVLFSQVIAVGISALLPSVYEVLLMFRVPNVFAVRTKFAHMSVIGQVLPVCVRAFPGGVATNGHVIVPKYPVMHVIKDFSAFCAIFAYHHVVPP